MGNPREEKIKIKTPSNCSFFLVSFLSHSLVTQRSRLGFVLFPVDPSHPSLRALLKCNLPCKLLWTSECYCKWSLSQTLGTAGRISWLAPGAPGAACGLYPCPFPNCTASPQEQGPGYPSICPSSHPHHRRVCLHFNSTQLQHRLFSMSRFSISLDGWTHLHLLEKGMSVH